MVALISNNRQEMDADFSITNEGTVIRAYTESRLVCIDSDINEYQVGLLLAYQPGQLHDYDFDAVLRSMKLKKRKSLPPQCFWDLTLNYSTEGPPPQEDSTDPTAARVVRSWTTSEQTIHTTRDRNGDIIINGAKQPFDGGIPVTLEMPTLSFVRNEYDFNGSIATDYANSLNRYTYSGAAPKTLKLKISAQEKWQGNYHYWEVKYDMPYFVLGWQPRPVNAGLFQLVSGALTRCRDKDRQDVTSPVPLDTAGLQVPIASLPSGVNYIDVDWHALKDFAALGLPENI